LEAGTVKAISAETQKAVLDVLEAQKALAVRQAAEKKATLQREDAEQDRTQFNSRLLSLLTKDEPKGPWLIEVMGKTYLIAVSASTADNILQEMEVHKCSTVVPPDWR
jgi:hypothetical protein